MSAPYSGPGFVDYHAHLLRTSSESSPTWARHATVRAYHEHCADTGVTPVDEIEDPDDENLPARLQTVLEQAASCGIVELWEAGVRSWRYVDALSSLREAGPLPVRVRLLVAAGLAETGMRARTADALFDVVGVKFYLDGWLRHRTCATSTPFLDEPSSDGILFEAPETLARRIEPFANRGWTIASHAIGDRAIECALDAYDLVFGNSSRQEGPRIEHAQLLREDLVSRMAAAGVVACIQPGFGVSDAPDVRSGLGGSWQLAYRWSALVAAGVRVITGSDYPIEPLEPLHGLGQLVMNPFDDMGVDAALAIMTDGAAGSVTLSADPRDVDPTSISGIEVLGTNVAQ